MGRHAEGWRLRQRAPGYAQTVRFTHNGVEYERSTGTADSEQAAREAAKIYADIVNREPAKRRPRRYGDSLPLEEVIGRWLADAALDPTTLPTYEVYGGHWLKHFEALHHITDATCEEYNRSRLKAVLGVTVRKEAAALRGFPVPHGAPKGVDYFDLHQAVLPGR
jgi:hypothetical protein